MGVYVIFHCNQWHEYASMRLIGVTTEDKLDEVLAFIKKQLDYSDQDMVDYIHTEYTDVDDIESMNI